MSFIPAPPGFRLAIHQFGQDPQLLPVLGWLADDGGHPVVIHGSRATTVHEGGGLGIRVKLIHPDKGIDIDTWDDEQVKADQESIEILAASYLDSFERIGMRARIGVPRDILRHAAAMRLIESGEAVWHNQDETSISPGPKWKRAPSD